MACIALAGCELKTCQEHHGMLRMIVLPFLVRVDHCFRNLQRGKTWYRLRFWSLRSGESNGNISDRDYDGVISKWLVLGLKLVERIYCKYHVIRYWSDGNVTSLLGAFLSSKFPPEKNSQNCPPGKWIHANSLERDMKPSDIITPQSIENAVESSNALGGSTNCSTALIGYRPDCRIDFTLEDFKALNAKHQWFADFKPSEVFDGRPHGSKGGFPAFMKYFFGKKDFYMGIVSP